MTVAATIQQPMPVLKWPMLGSLKLRLSGLYLEDGHPTRKRGGCAAAIFFADVSGCRSMPQLHGTGICRIRPASSIATLRWILVSASCLFAAHGLRADEPARILGPASCASATCHGGLPGVGPAWHSSAHVWESDDRHAEAGMVLLNAQSCRIVGNLEPRAG